MIPDTTTEEAYPETTILVPETETRTETKLGEFSFANSVFDVLKGKTWREALRHATNSSVNLGTVKEATESANVTGPLTSSKGNDKHQSMWNDLFRALVKEAEKASNSGPIDLPTKATTSSANVNSNTVSTRQEEEQTGYFTFSVKPKVTTAMPESNHYTQTSLQDEVDFDDMKKPQDIVKPTYIPPTTLTSTTMKPPTPVSMTTTTTQSKTPAQSTPTRSETLTTMEGSAQGTLITTSVTAGASDSSPSTSSVISTTEKSKTTLTSTSNVSTVFSSALSSRFPSTTTSTSYQITTFLTTTSPTPSRLTTLTTTSSTSRSTSTHTSSKTTPTGSTSNTAYTRLIIVVHARTSIHTYVWICLCECLWRFL